MRLFKFDRQETQELLARDCSWLVFSSLILVAIFGWSMDFMFAELFSRHHEWGAIETVFVEIIAVPLGILVVYLISLGLLVFCANRGIWGYGSAVIVGAMLGFAIPVILLILFPVLSEYEWAERISLAIGLGAHGAIMYGVPGAILVLYRLSSRKDVAFDAVFSTNSTVRFLLVMAPFAAMLTWHYLMARFDLPPMGI